MKTSEASAFLSDAHSCVNDKPEYILCEGDSNQWSVGITRATIERILKSDSEDRGDMLALWMFYAYTCRWQQVSQAKATVAYVAKGMEWSEQRVKKARNGLKELGLIDDVQSRTNEGQVAGWYVAVRYLAKASKNHPVENPPSGETTPKCSRTLNGNAQEHSADGGKASKSHPEHQKFIDAWMRYYAERHGGQVYPFTSRDGLAVKGLLAHFKTSKSTGDFIKACHARPHEFPFKNIETLYDFHSNLARLLAALNPPAVFRKCEAASKRPDRFENPTDVLVQKALADAEASQ